MDHTQSIITEVSNAVARTLRSTGYFDSAENAPVSQPYRKHIIWLKKRSDEASLNVVIKAEIERAVDCNQVFLTPAKLKKNPSGYFRLDYPYFDSTKVACPVTHVETMALVLTDNTLDYSSAHPIVIHAHRDIDISYVVEEKITSIE